MRKSIVWTIVGICLVVIIVAGAYVGLHRSPSNTTKTTVTNVSNSVLATKTSSSLGQYLTNLKGMTLYTYSGDSNGVSRCTGSCLSSWPAYVDAGSVSGLPLNVSTIKRSDNGELQYTYKGKPLYYFTGDTKAGEVNGNDVTGFSIVRP